MLKKRTALCLALLLLVPLAGCTTGGSEGGLASSPSAPSALTSFESSREQLTEESRQEPSSPSSGGEKMSYEMISQQQAKEIMDSTQPHVVLDVREEYEFEAGHIKNAILIPHEQIKELAPTLLPDKNALILVYCRSGRRSKIAAEALADMGYGNVKEFGGIEEWRYDVVK